VPFFRPELSSMSSRTKVFVGNLSFKTRAADLAGEFSIAGKVVSAHIITRGSRSLGYGFVEFETEEDAQKAVTLLNKKNVDSRDINVEIAKPLDESKLAERRASAPRGRGRGGGNRGFRGGGGYDQGGGQGRRNYRNQDGGWDNRNNNNNPGPRRNRAPRRSFSPRNNSNRPSIPSQTTLFVANLPFAINDGDLFELFKPFNVSKAHVVINRFGRSKGFGFVDFANEADQKAALAEFEKKPAVLANRELIIKIALSLPREPQREKDAPNKEKEPNSPPPN